MTGAGAFWELLGAPYHQLRTFHCFLIITEKALWGFFFFWCFYITLYCIQVIVTLLIVAYTDQLTVILTY